MEHVSIYANQELLLIQPCAGLRRQRDNPEESGRLLSPVASAAEIGRAVLDALSRYRRISPEEIGPFFDLTAIDRDYEAWVAGLCQRFGYKNRKSLFQAMKRCSVQADERTICVRPTKHEKLEAWSGTGIDAEDNVIVERNADPHEIGRAVLVGLERCR